MGAWLLVLLVVALTPAAGGEPPRLVATVGPDFTIDLVDASGQHVTVLTAGRYELVAHDLSDIHNLVLGSKSTGARLIDTGVEFVGDMTVTIELKPGLYAYACSPHFDTMNGQLQVVPAPRPAEPRALRATVASGRPTLSATRVAAGRYRLTIADRSRSANFHLVGPGIDRRTGKAFTGTVTWTLQLERGSYRFGSDPRLSGRLIVT